VDLDAYVAEHAGEWRRLDYLSRRRKVSAEEADDLIALYQRAATHLSVIRSRSPDPALVARLSRMVLAGRAAITGGQRYSWRGVRRFLAVTFPLEVYLARRWWIGVSLVFTVLAAALMTYVATNPDVARAFLTDDQLDAIVNSEFAGYYSEFRAQNFAFAVWTNNAFLTAQVLVSGVLIVPVFYLLGLNLLNLGLIGGLMIGHGRSDVFFGLILPHGLLELTAVFVGAGAGLRIGWAWIAPGPHRTRGRALAETARGAVLVALGLVLVLGVSGILEAFITPSGLPTVLRVGIGVLAWLGFLGYVQVLGARAARAGETGDVEAHLRDADVPAV
jgi:uncharacterized membrane protein SpoIIM required for sporulation